MALSEAYVTVLHHGDTRAQRPALEWAVARLDAVAGGTAGGTQAGSAASGVAIVAAAVLGRPSAAGGGGGGSAALAHAHAHAAVFMIGELCAAFGFELLAPGPAPGKRRKEDVVEQAASRLARAASRGVFAGAPSLSAAVAGLEGATLRAAALDALVRLIDGCGTRGGLRGLHAVTLRLLEESAIADRSPLVRAGVGTAIAALAASSAGFASVPGGPLLRLALRCIGDPAGAVRASGALALASVLATASLVGRAAVVAAEADAAAARVAALRSGGGPDGAGGREGLDADGGGEFGAGFGDDGGDDVGAGGRAAGADGADGGARDDDDDGGGDAAPQQQTSGSGKQRASTRGAPSSTSGAGTAPASTSLPADGGGRIARTLGGGLRRLRLRLGGAGAAPCAAPRATQRSRRSSWAN